MTEATHALDKFFGVVFFADEKYCFADDLNAEAEGFICTARETKKMSKCAAASKYVSVHWLAPDRIQSGFHSWRKRVIWILSGIGIPIVGAIIFLQSSSDLRGSPLWRLTCLQSVFYTALDGTITHLAPPR